jgi:hypothetical protein
LPKAVEGRELQSAIDNAAFYAQPSALGVALGEKVMVHMIPVYAAVIPAAVMIAFVVSMKGCGRR